MGGRRTRENEEMEQHSLTGESKTAGNGETAVARETAGDLAALVLPLPLDAVTTTTEKTTNGQNTTIGTSVSPID